MKIRMVAMIPARLESKRIPKKNIRYMGNKPLIRYPIDLAKESNRFESIWINTESKELGDIIKNMGVGFHKRPAELANDQATNRDFTYEFLQKHDCDYVIMINPTSPLLRKETLICFLDFVEKHDFDTVLSVISKKEETFYKGEPLNFSLKEKINSQLLEPTEAICWSLTAWKRENFLKMQENGENPVFGGILGRYSIPKDEACDLDTMEDWKIAEGILMSRLQNLEERYMKL